ncbi:single-stranded-DNA-specific exonuclease RecJ [Arenimonas fontis]|uniref:Single-stranded-DNA-specific exonuclease RecJ n=1 Tax=Arenimonas fontis TaxID=2608255 RepID=A0A5B2ZG57_9GAMM|nr:single-stranded-DNA-specific exonuclease RecJ [Arenimonas fontis]KAA2286042.1 single-stranded-DNA-specific exonuclease RecJ [Arenimonas fontis]
MNRLRLRRRPVPASGPWPASVPPALRRVCAARGVLGPEDAELRLARLAPPEGLSGMASAVELLRAAIAEDRHIVVVGDFDCDGATGTAVAVRGLRMLGARRVSYRVPHRLMHGYGLSLALVDDLRRLRPDLVLTVDSGIACHAGIAAARAEGWRVLVSDHHLPASSLPEADAIVNPNLPGDAFPSKALAGVGVVFYLLLALRQRLRADGAFARRLPEPDLGELLDLVAVGTVADLVPLDYNNRLLVAAGLRRLREGRCRPGLRALVELAGREPALLSAGDIGFGLAPRLNAAGRLDDMSLGIECLLCDEPERARELALMLDGINAERRELQAQMLEQAERLAAATVEGQGGLPDLVCVHDPAWHAGVVGLVASKLKDRWHRPVIAFAGEEEGEGMLKGSARSIPGLHIRDALAAVDARHPGLIGRFGGHAMAAGLSLAPEQLAAFAEAMRVEVGRRLSEEQRLCELWTDGELAPEEIERGLAERLRLAGPWGQGFPEPVFEGEFELLEAREVGRGHLRMRLRHADGGPVLGGIQFGGWTGERPPGRLRLAYELDLDDWGGRRGVQLRVRHLEPAPMV